MKAKASEVKLRPIKLSDALRYVKWLNDPAITASLAREPGITVKEEIRWIKDLKKDKTRKSLAITYLGQHVGGVSLDKINRASQSAFFGIFVGEKKFQNMGIGTIATKKILDYGFRKLKLHKISLHVFPDNKPAIRVYKKLGFKQEGYIKDNIIKRGRFRDDLLMAIIKK